jgi:hypothetical protein
VRTTIWLATVVLALAACAPAAPPPPPAPPPPADTAPRPDPALLETRIRWSLRPVPVTDAFGEAVRNGTRTMDGRPGPRYWQQRVEYRIAAELDPARARVQGEETITYHNRSPDTLSHLVLHLYQNVFAPGVQRVRRVPPTDGITLENVAVDGATARAASPQAGRATYRIDGTVMTLQLPRPLPPGGRVSLDIAWHFTVPPRGAPRTGHDDREAFVVAQWYPQIATYDDIHGWHDLPYWSNGEFYLEYGDFDVSLTVPEGWLVGASGTLQNAEEVLAPQTLERLDAARTQNDIVRVVTADDHQAGLVTVQEPGGQLTWRFTAGNVRDFAFAASNRYLWDATRAVTPDADGDGRPEIVAVNALYRPEAAAWRRAAEYMRHATTFHAERWFPYQYPQITAAEGPIGGMEYPMLVFIGAPADPVALYSVLSHEIAHQWWSMLVGSNETRYAWQDEGLATYVEDLSVKDFFPESEPQAATRDSYLNIAGTDIEKPIMTQPDLFGIGPQYGVAAYTKPGTLFHTLAALAGEDRVQAALRVYANRWKNAHPAPWDLFHTVEDVIGRDLDWFWTPWFFETATLDQAIVAVDVAPADSAGERVTITIEDQGDAPLPVPLTITLANGQTQEVLLTVDAWLEGRVRQQTTIVVPAAVQRIEIDAAGRLPDVDRGDNVWVRR